MLLSDYGDKVDDTMKHYLERINDGALKMGTLIDDLLDFSRTTRGEIQYKIVDVETIVNNVINEHKTKHQERNIEFVVHDLQKVEADERMIGVIFFNLIDNAEKYTGRCDNARIEIGSKREKDEIQFFVKDNGAGFDMKFKDKLFNAFQRLHSEKEFEGSGIGLATVARLVSKHGGRTWAEGEVDKGATFYFAFPIKKYV